MRLRPARTADAETLLAWRNDAVTRRFAFDRSEVDPSEHRMWLDRKLANPACELWIGESERGDPVGEVRFDLEADGIATIDIAVAPEARGRGIGLQLLRAAMAAHQSSASEFRAEVDVANAASRRTFERAGFTQVAEDATRVTFCRPRQPRLTNR